MQGVGCVKYANKITFVGWEMDIRKIMVVICCTFSSYVWAEETSQVVFQQILKIKPEQRYEVELENVQPSDHIWTAVYLIGKQNYPGPTSKVDFLIENQGLLNKANASEHVISKQLIAEDLPETHYYSLNQFKQLRQFIEKETEQKIEDPILEEDDTIRIYSQVNDWIPEYNSYEPTKVKIAVQNPVDFNIVAAYVLVGRGEKPTQLNELGFNRVLVTDHTNSVKPMISESTYRSDMSMTRSNFKLIWVLASALVFACCAFIYRNKLRHRV